MSEEVLKRLLSLFERVTDGSVTFEKSMYPDVFAGLYEEYRDVLDEAAKAVEQAEDVQQQARVTAGFLVEYAKKEKIDLSLPRRKVDMLLLDYNLGLATFFLPLLNHHPSEGSGRIAKELVAAWNETFHTQLSNSDYERIQEGFQKRLCYITTAVCRSFGRPDDCYELEMLRNYRDQYLLAEAHGTELVQEYYDTAPTIVKRINRQKNSSDIYRRVWEEYLEQCLDMIEAGDMEGCKEVYSNMVYELQKKYLYSQEEIV